MKAVVGLVTLSIFVSTSAWAQQAAVKGAVRAGQAAKPAPRVEAPTGSLPGAQTSIGASEAAQAGRIGAAGAATAPSAGNAATNIFSQVQNSPVQAGEACVTPYTLEQGMIVAKAFSAGVGGSSCLSQFGENGSYEALDRAIRMQQAALAELEAMGMQSVTAADFAGLVKLAKAKAAVVASEMNVDGVETLSQLCKMGCDVTSSALCSPRVLQAARL